MEDNFQPVRTLSLKIIRDVEQGALLDESIDRCFSSPGVPAHYKPLIYELTSGVVRWRLYLDWILSHFVKETIKRDVRYLLWMSLYQVFFMKKAFYHVVNEAVDYTKKDKGQRVANFVNAVLRRAITEKEHLTLPSDPVARLSVEYSFPTWLVKRWHARFGSDATRDLLDVMNRSPEFALRIDLAKISREEVMSRLHKKGVNTRKGRFLESALYVDKIGPVLDDDLLKKHVIHVQAETSQMAALALAPGRSELILDACAGQGTKTGHVRETFPDVRVVAMDLEIKRLRSVGATNCIVQGDVLKNPLKSGRFDSILLDAPCSSLGIIRKHPEIKWRRREKDMTMFGGLQLEMFKNVASNLKPDGVLVYSVCSFEPEETTEVVEQSEKEKLFVREKPLPHLFDKDQFLSLPQQSGMDGFFIARLRKL